MKGGRCEACQGDGLVKIEMHFLPDVYVPCEVCKGKRYNRETLEVRFRGLIDRRRARADRRRRARRSSRTSRAFARSSQTLADVGLGYIHLGQSATTLSGGEAQRVKLATELSKRDTGRTFYILDEPTTGLHFEDVRVLLDVLHRLVDRGNTVLVIEHNLDVIKTADWIIDLGPEGGNRGGRIVAPARRRTSRAVEASHTGQLPAARCSRKVASKGRLAEQLGSDSIFIVSTRAASALASQYGLAARHHRTGHGRPVDHRTRRARADSDFSRAASSAARRSAREDRAARFLRAHWRGPRNRQGDRRAD